jgi:hypothetical protein
VTWFVDAGPAVGRCRRSPRKRFDRRLASENDAVADGIGALVAVVVALDARAFDPTIPSRAAASPWVEAVILNLGDLALFEFLEGAVRDVSPSIDSGPSVPLPSSLRRLSVGSNPDGTKEDMFIYRYVVSLTVVR